MRTFVIGWITALGLCIGSFLTVVTSRVPAGGSILAPPSMCPGCGARIRWFDNVPVLSWIALRGRCRHCRMRIPIRYPALELGVGVVFGGVASFVRPLFVPVVLAVMTGAAAFGVSSVIHRRLSRGIATASAIVIIIAAFATAGVALLASR